MNAIKRFSILALCLVLVFSCFTGCHEKGEIAVVIGDEQFTSGYYACALVFADMDGREMVNATLDTATLISGDIKYWKQTIDGTDYTTWVENTALDKLKLIAAAKKLYKQYNVTPDDATTAEYKQLFDQLWLDSNVADFMEENGVARETFEDFAYYSYLLDSTFFETYFGLESTTDFTNPLFDKLYGEGGVNEIPAEDIKNYLNDNYVLANLINVSFTGLADEEKAQKEEEIDAYAKALKDGTKTFEEVYNEYYEITDDEEDTEDDETTDTDSVSQPLDPYSLPLSEETTDLGSWLAYGFDYIDTVKSMAIDEIKIITVDDEEDEGLILVVKKDITADPYYLTTGDKALREEIVGEDFINNIKTEANALSCNVNKKSTRQFKVKKIYYPEATY